MNIKKQNDNTELKKYIKEMFYKINENKFKPVMPLFSDYKMFMHMEQKDLNNFLNRVISKDIKISHIQNYLIGDKNTEINNWYTENNGIYKTLTQINIKNSFNLFIYGEGVYKVADIYKAIYKCKNLYKITDRSNPIYTSFFIEE